MKAKSFLREWRLLQKQLSQSLKRSLLSIWGLFRNLLPCLKKAAFTSVVIAVFIALFQWGYSIHRRNVIHFRLSFSAAQEVTFNYRNLDKRMHSLEMLVGDLLSITSVDQLQEESDAWLTRFTETLMPYTCISSLTLCLNTPGVFSLDSYISLQFLYEAVARLREEEEQAPLRARRILATNSDNSSDIEGLLHLFVEMSAKSWMIREKIETLYADLHWDTRFAPINELFRPVVFPDRDFIEEWWEEWSPYELEY